MTERLHFHFSLSCIGEGNGNPLHWIIEKAREFQKNIYLCFIDYTKDFDCGSQEAVENSERDGNTRPPDMHLEKPIIQVRKQQLELDM